MPNVRPGNPLVNYPAMGVIINQVNPERPIAAFWISTEGNRMYVGKRKYSDGSVQGFATSDPCDASGYETCEQAKTDIAELGYDFDWIEYGEYKGQMKLFI